MKFIPLVRYSTALLTILATLSGAPRVAAADEPLLTNQDVYNLLKQEKAGTLTEAQLGVLIKGKTDFQWTDKEKAYFKTLAGVDDKDIKLLDSFLSGSTTPATPAGSPLLANSTNTLALFDIMVGAKLENPYSIDTTAATLKPNNTKTDGFIEARVSTRYIFRNGDYDWTTCRPPDGRKLGLFMPEFDFTVGYVFRGKSTSSNLTTSTIAGGSDFYSDISVAEPFYRFATKDNTFKLETTVELAGGFVTDKDFDRIHPTGFGGLGLELAKVRTAKEASQGDVFFSIRLGYARFDQPQLVGTTVVLDAFKLPRFSQTDAVSAGISTSYRMSKAIFLRLGGNVYFKERASWNLSAGVSVDPSKFLPSSN